MSLSDEENTFYVVEKLPNYPSKYSRFHRCSNLRNSSRRGTERIVFKNGHFNLEKSTSKYHVFPDIVTTFVEARWRWTLIYCILTYITTWLIFAAVWWLILYSHGDLEDDHLPHAINTTEWTPCIREIYDFTSIFLFSIEIHTTIGYGTRSLTLECPEAMITMCIESILGTIIQSFIIGIVFAKLTRPKNRAQTLLFSKNAIINQRDRYLSLIFRIGNTRKSRIIASSVHAYLIRYITKLGQNKLKNTDQIKLDLKVDNSEDILFMFPISAVHRIDEKSPFYSMSAYDMLKTRLEILVVFEGTIESTGQPVQAKSSYTAHEILWGHRFLQLMSYSRAKRGLVIDYAKFDETIRVNTPLCSARELREFYEFDANTQAVVAKAITYT
ncbi:G protein-activated inward rectifier potassium channel 3-like [Pectinophora gossypiella]|uniref:G protein-activated inward rectifier potassium channel 3-like n=1 Tax=Pectinophora gossypiella TaxID=13191 RepID=UPI00214E457E|nr:G protein-activated inward rectifier potassium channel 3-like [Pectinophora gossypiella]